MSAGHHSYSGQPADRTSKHPPPFSFPSSAEAFVADVMKQEDVVDSDQTKRVRQSLLAQAKQAYEGSPMNRKRLFVDLCDSTEETTDYEEEDDDDDDEDFLCPHGAKPGQLSSRSLALIDDDVFIQEFTARKKSSGRKSKKKHLTRATVTYRPPTPPIPSPGRRGGQEKDTKVRKRSTQVLPQKRRTTYGSESKEDRPDFQKETTERCARRRRKDPQSPPPRTDLPEELQTLIRRLRSERDEQRKKEEESNTISLLDDDDNDDEKNDYNHLESNIICLLDDDDDDDQIIENDTANDKWTQQSQNQTTNNNTSSTNSTTEKKMMKKIKKPFPFSAISTRWPRRTVCAAAAWLPSTTELRPVPADGRSQRALSHHYVRPIAFAASDKCDNTNQDNDDSEQNNNINKEACVDAVSSLQPS